jgi:hypothetical protein
MNHSLDRMGEAVYQDSRAENYIEKVRKLELPSQNNSGNHQDHSNSLREHESAGCDMNTPKPFQIS